MIIHNETKASKVAARIINEAGRINKAIEITISERSPESINRTGTIPRKKGWRDADNVPLTSRGRKDYVAFLKGTKEYEIYIRLATNGGRSRIYVR
jgi:hypothetical protein